MTSSDALGDRMKSYEKLSQQRFMPRLPIIARLDGKGFSKWTRNFRRPYDERMSRTMVETTRRLVEETNACIGYTQSDEITLVFYSDSEKSQVFFDGKIAKMHSVIASMCTAYFNEIAKTQFDCDLPDNPAIFDCRVFQVPTLEEAANAVLWRERDATKNSVSMATRSYYSHKEMMNKNSSEMQDMLMDKGINWNDYPLFFKRGTFIQRVKSKRAFTIEEIDSLPEKHQARKNPNLLVERTDYKEIDMPPFGKVLNRADVIFNGSKPLMEIQYVANAQDLAKVVPIESEIPRRKKRSPFEEVDFD